MGTKTYTFAEKLAATRAYMKAERRRAYASITLGMAFAVITEHFPDMDPGDVHGQLLPIQAALHSRADETREAWKAMRKAFDLKFFNPRHARFEIFIDELAKEGL